MIEKTNDSTNLINTRAEIKINQQQIEGYHDGLYKQVYPDNIKRDIPVLNLSSMADVMKMTLLPARNITQYMPGGAALSLLCATLYYQICMISAHESSEEKAEPPCRKDNVRRDPGLYECHGYRPISKICVSSGDLCNGSSGCKVTDGEIPIDEKDCYQETCNNLGRPHRCKSGFDHRCLPYWQRCDGRTDCLDGSDELYCKSPEHCQEFPGRPFLCDKHRCLEADKVCNGYDECNDKTDEAYCTKAICDTQNSTVWCVSRCLPESVWCNTPPGQQPVCDCPWCVDEQNCNNYNMNNKVMPSDDTKTQNDLNEHKVASVTTDWVIVIVLITLGAVVLCSAIALYKSCQRRNHINESRCARIYNGALDLFRTRQGGQHDVVPGEEVQMADV